MKHTLEVQTKQQPVAIERLLRVVRHRGFKVQNLELAQQPDPVNQSFFLKMTVDSDKPLYLLTQQLDKLADVIFVSTADANQKQAI